LRLILVTGGARGGKSRYAQARAADLGGDRVTVIATARSVDAEMERRIARHREQRPVAWTTVEAPRRVGDAILAARTDVVLLDCLSVLAGNALADARPQDEGAAMDAMRSETDGLLGAVQRRDGTLVVVTNEVGFGVHPPTSLGRWFRDGLGEANRRIAEIAHEVVLMVSGLPVSLK
jgi:adenosylcobinamide kinase/adenosylcobinamide-phosphate guanylyltransferase